MFEVADDWDSAVGAGGYGDVSGHWVWGWGVAVFGRSVRSGCFWVRGLRGF